MLATARRWAVIHELRGAPEPSLDALLARMTPVDLVIVEGFKRFPHPKLEVHRRERGTPLLAGEDASIIALATDEPFPTLALPQFGLDDIAGDRRLRARPPRHRGTGVTRLENDCFAYGGDRITVRAAHALLRERIAPSWASRRRRSATPSAGALPPPWSARVTCRHSTVPLSTVSPSPIALACARRARA